MIDHELEMRLAEINGSEPEEPTEEDLAAIRAAEAEPAELVTLEAFKREMEALVHPYADIRKMKSWENWNDQENRRNKACTGTR